MPERASITVTLYGTPEQNRDAYRQVLDCLDDLTDITKGDFPVWSCHMASDLDRDWRDAWDPDEERSFLTEDMEGFIERTLTGRPKDGTVQVIQPKERPNGSL